MKSGKTKSLLHAMDFRPRDRRAFDLFLLHMGGKLRESGWAAHYLFSAPPPGGFADRLAELGVGWTAFPKPFSPRSFPELYRLTAALRPTVLQTSFTSSFSPSILLLKLLRRCERLVVVDHSSGKASPKRGLARRAARLRGRAAGRLIDRILPVSDFVRSRDIDAFLPAEKMTTIHNGIDLDRFPERPVERPGPPRVVFVGQLIPPKGVDILIRSFRRVLDEFPDAVLEIAGEGSQEADLKSLAREQGGPAIRFLGRVDDVPGLFAGARVAVVPSVWDEAFGYVAAEAMACGTPVVASAVGGLPEVVGEGGALVPPGEPAALAEQIAGMLRDEEARRELGRRGRRRVVERFDLALAVERQHAILEEVVRARG